MHHAPQLAARDRIDADARFVQQQHLGFAHQRVGQSQFLLHAAGQLARQTPGEAGQIGEFQQPFEGLAAKIAGDAAQIGVQRQVLHHRQILIQPEFLRHVAEDRMQLAILADRIQPGDPQFAAAWLQQPGQHAQQGGFAGAVRADQPDDRAAVQGGGQAGDRRFLKRREALFQPCQLDGVRLFHGRPQGLAKRRVTGMP